MEGNLTERTDSLAQCQSFSLTGNDNDNFPRVQNCLYADWERYKALVEAVMSRLTGKRHTWYGRDVIVEESSVRKNRVIRESLYASARFQRRT
jgi:hypothetical protein